MRPRLALPLPLACLVAAACAHASVEATPDATADAADAAGQDVVVDAPEEAAVDAGHGQPTRLAVTSFQTSVIDRPQWPESGGGAKRLGYLRQGSVVDAYDRPVVNDDCKDGWFELVSPEPHGFVCGKAVTAEMSSAKVRLAPHQPDRDAGMPYRYGVNLQTGTPLYRRVLSVEDRKKFEPDLAPPKQAAHEEAQSEGEEAAQPEEKEKEREKESSKKDAGADAGKPKLKELKGRGVLVRKMERGFYVALDKDFKAAGAHWWRTTFGFATPFERIAVQQSQTKHVGAWFESTPLAEEVEDGGASLAGAVGFVSFASQKLAIEDGKVKWGPELTKRSAVMLTGKTQVVSGVTYHEAAGGFWVRVGDLKLAKPQPPADLGPSEKWIDVDLTRQTLVAFEGSRPIFGTLISSGRRNPWDKEKDFPTPAGTFRILEKHVTTTMDGDVASDGPYSIEDVPWVMYFQGSYALHGAFWHDAFGHPRSHGCVNMAPDDARTLFGWADPQLPPGWHGVVAKSDKDGTRLVIHEDPAPKPPHK